MTWNQPPNLNNLPIINVLIFLSVISFVKTIQVIELFFQSVLRRDCTVSLTKCTTGVSAHECPKHCYGKKSAIYKCVSLIWSFMIAYTDCRSRQCTLIKSELHTNCSPSRMFETLRKQFTIKALKTLNLNDVVLLCKKKYSVFICNLTTSVQYDSI